MPAEQTTQFAAVAQLTHDALARSAPGAAPADPRAVLAEYVRPRQLADDVVPALAAITSAIGDQVREHGTLAKVPSALVANVRNDMYLASEAIRLLEKNDKVAFDDST